MNDMSQKFYEIVKKQHKEHVENGFTSEHAYTAGILGAILIKMDKARNEALGEFKSIGQILDDFYDSSQKEFLVEHMKGLKKPDENNR